MGDAQTTRIEVGFGVDVPVEAIAEIEKKMEMVRPGSVEYAVVWDQRKALHTQFMSRLEGECAAYMNIAKEHARQLFGI
jgi:hypothetical protein